MEQASAPGQIIILNGTPRSGKSSIVAEIQATFDGVWMNLGVDRFMQATPARWQPGIGLRPGGERPDLEPLVSLLYRALYESIAAHSRLGLNVVVDVGHHDAHSVPRGILADCARRLSGLPVLFVGVRCPIEVIMERRRNTGWSAADSDDAETPPPVLMWQREVHRPGIYDLEIDTSVLSSGECAALIHRRLIDGPAPSAFGRIAAMPARRSETGENEMTVENKTLDEALIRGLIENRAQAIHEKDANTLLADYAGDVVMFTLAPPLQFAGADKKALEQWFASYQGPIGCEISDLSITQADGIAFCHYLTRICGTRTDGQSVDMWMRATVGLNKIDGDWKVTHEHLSVPFDMETLQALLNLKP